MELALWAVCSLRDVDPLLVEQEVRDLLRAGWIVEGARALNPLHAAIQQGYVGAIAALVEAGADINLQAPDGSRPIHWAAMSKRVDVLKAVLEAGADVTAKEPDGTQAIHLAVACGTADTLKVLVDAGADIHSISGRFGAPVRLAAGCITRETLDYLLATGANPNVQTPGHETPLIGAVLNGRHVRELLAAGADPNLRDEDGYAPLFWAQSQRVARMLVEAGAVVDEVALKNPRVRAVRDKILLKQARAQKRALAGVPAAVKPRRRA